MCALTSALRTREGSFEGHAHEARRAFARIPAYAHYCPGKNAIPIFVAPAKTGVQAYARMALCAFAWIPAYAGTTMLLSLAKLKARGCSRFFAPIVVPAIPTFVAPAEAGVQA